MSKTNRHKGFRYPHVVPDMKDWPIHRIHNEREALIDNVAKRTLEWIRNLENRNDYLAKTIYKERIRVKAGRWKADPPNEKLIWNKLQKELAGASILTDETQKTAIEMKIASQIIYRYSEEITGNFKIRTFLFARKFLTVVFNRLLNTASNRNMRRIYSARYHLYERMKPMGQIDHVRNLADKGTLVFVPTHFSNLDSPLLGYCIDLIGIPAFSYGAGLNLYANGLVAYFFNRLGAYRLDRRKKNPIYLETLKSYSAYSIEKGMNTLFFPGGTRSRSGALEKRLKMGLLGTLVEAQQNLIANGEERKVFVVPVMMSYHSVLDAKPLILDYLKREGKEQFFNLSSKKPGFRDYTKFIWKSFSKSSEMIISLGKPLDILGNEVDFEGQSIVPGGSMVKLEDYFKQDGVVQDDNQRNQEYTRLLSEKIVSQYKKEYLILSSDVLSYAAFNIFLRQNTRLDLYGVLRLPPEDYRIERSELSRCIQHVQEVLIKRAEHGEITISDPIRGATKELIQHGLKNLGVFHPKKPLQMSKDENYVVSEDFILLYYYHNKLEGYDLAKTIPWEKFAFELI